MWNIFLLVIIDLWQFVFQPLPEHAFIESATPALPAPAPQPRLGNLAPSLLLSTSVPVTQVTLPTSETLLSELPIKPATQLPKNELLDEPVNIVTAPLNEPVIMYVTNLAGSPCLKEPTSTFDVILTQFSFGTAVTVAAFSGRYARIQKGVYLGWVTKDDLTPHKTEVWPEFETWGMYGIDNPVTQKVRALIADEFGAGLLNLPLQGGEYVMMRLLQDQRKIAWPTNRPRLPGNWQRLLKGVLGIHSTINPKTDSIMEWQTESDGGRVAYVEAVGLDGTITTSCVGLVMAGQFTKQVWGQEDWRELRPTFIEVS